MIRGLKHVFFDVGNTLLFPDRDTILAPLAARGIMPTVTQWDATEHRTKLEFDQAMKDAEVDQGFWFRFYAHLLEELRVTDESIHAQLVTATRTSANWCKILPGTREVLQRVANCYQIAVISNADGKIDQVLRRCGIADCFLTITDSGIVGHEKPHPAIFENAMAAMKANPYESLYVGDMYSVDYAGAKRVGMNAVLLDRCEAYRQSAFARVETLHELENWLGLRSEALL